MFAIAMLVGLLSYVIFFLGIAGLLYKGIIISCLILFLVSGLHIYRLYAPAFNFKRFYAGLVLLPVESKIILSLLMLQAAVNFIGTLGPELAFDALWYHLTIPKLYIIYHRIAHFAGGLLYYSDMSKLTEMLYTAGLIISNEILNKIIHFTFGILVALSIFKIARMYVNQKLSILASLLFYSNPVVGWMSITSYIDLTRTFYEVLAFWSFAKYCENRHRKYFYLSAVLLGFAISAKLLSLGSLAVFILLIIFSSQPRTDIIKVAKSIIIFVFIALTVSLPWFIFAFINTGNPIYPIFSVLSPDTHFEKIFSPLFFFNEIFTLFIRASDPVSPIYLIILPVIIYLLPVLLKKYKLLVVYGISGLLIWYITPHSGGGRFILPYLPVFSILVIVVLSRIKNRAILLFSVLLIIGNALISIGYRTIANKKYLPVITGKQSKSEFLSNNLKFDFGDFYDVDGYFAKNIKPDDKVLIIGIHNLYYVDFPFIHESYLKNTDNFNYILINEGKLPQAYSRWTLKYQNSKSRVRLYKDPATRNP